MVLAILLTVGLMFFIYMAIKSQTTPDQLGIRQGMLLPCPNSPNCVGSEANSQTSKEHAVAPIRASDGAWAKLKSRIIEQDGVIKKDDGHYLHATFTSCVFHYVDDVELRLDAGHDLIQIRSASRVGRSDFGVNRKRVEALRR